MTATTMSALVYEGPEVMTPRVVATPEVGPDDVLVRVAYSGICGSELSGFLGQSSLRQAPLIFGHEVSGWVEAIGDQVPAQLGLAVGAEVAVNPLRSCGRCRHCLTGHQQRCADRRLLGAHLPGANAQYLTVGAHSVHQLPAGMDLRDAATAEPAAFALHAVRLSGVTATDTALVIGAGPIGQLLLQVLGQIGVRRRLFIETNPARRAMAERLGATPIAADGDVGTAVRAAAGNAGVSVAFDAVGTVSTRRDCLASADSGATVVLVGLHTDETSLPINTVIRNELRIIGVFAYTPVDFADALDWIAAGRVHLHDGMVVAPLADGPGWYRRLVDGDPASKVLLQPDPVGGAG